MITDEKFELYRDEDFIKAVEENILRDPGEIALDKRLPLARELATRVKYLQKARGKLPSYYGARCVIPPRAYEQSTNEAVASEKRYTGGSCLDLTCGLGVDSFAMSKNFGNVVAVERDPLLAEIARYNFGLLGAANIEVVNSSAERYLTENPGIKFDLVYADPDRRDTTGKRVAALEDCSPDIRAILPELKNIARVVAVKLSPLFDVHEAFRVFGGGTRVTVVSDGGECKEVLVETGAEIEGKVIAARITGQGEVSFDYGGISRTTKDNATGLLDSEYLAVPDVALAKGDIALDHYRSVGWRMNSPRGFAFGNRPVPKFGSRVYKIGFMEPYNPRHLKKLLKAEGIDRINFYIRDFPYPAAQAARQLGITEGGTRFAALTTLSGKPHFILLGETP